MCNVVLTVTQRELDLKKTLSEPTIEIAEHWVYSNAQFLVMIENIMEDYDNKKAGVFKTLDRINNVILKYG